MTEQIEYDPAFESWEAEKEYKLKKLHELSEYMKEMTAFLSQHGIQGDTLASKINYILGALIKKGVLTEKDVLDMEMVFTETCAKEMKAVCEQVNADLNQRKLIVPNVTGNVHPLIVPNRK